MITIWNNVILRYTNIAQSYNDEFKYVLPIMIICYFRAVRVFQSLDRIPFFRFKLT